MLLKRMLILALFLSFDPITIVLKIYQVNIKRKMILLIYFIVMQDSNVTVLK